MYINNDADVGVTNRGEAAGSSPMAVDAVPNGSPPVTFMLTGVGKEPVRD
jgi:hypothetical protein